MNQPHCAFDDMAGQLVNQPEPPICEHCGRLIAHCDDDDNGCGSTQAEDDLSISQELIQTDTLALHSADRGPVPTKAPTWRDKPGML